MTEKIYLGRVKKDYKYSMIVGEMLWISKHSWECGWYWGFGYIGNRNSHTHFDSAFLEGQSEVASEVFEDIRFTDNEWWIIRDLFVQAYALKKAAEIYKHGGHQITKIGITDIIVDTDIVTRLNKDTEIVLDKVWNFMKDCQENQTMLKEEISRYEKELEKLNDKKNNSIEEYNKVDGIIRMLKRDLKHSNS